MHAIWLAAVQLPPHACPAFTQADRAPCGAPLTPVQVPTAPATSQAWHWPPQAESQHTPSTQFPDEHWFAPAQLIPFPFFSVQVPLAQK